MTDSEGIDAGLAPMYSAYAPSAPEADPAGAVITSRLKRMSFRTRLGTFVAVAVGVTVFLAAVASYYAVKHQLLSETDSALRGDLTTSAAFAPDGVDVSIVARLANRSHGFVQVITPAGGTNADGTLSNVVYTTNPDERFLAPTTAQLAVARAGGDTYRIDTVHYNGQPYRMITQTVTDPYLPGVPFAIQVSQPLNTVYHTLSTLRIILWLVTVGGVVCAVGLGYMIGRATLRPVARLTAAAEHVAATQDLSSTIEVESDDELGRLAKSFNAMLDALAESRQQQAQLISDAGHELRTPLTSLRTNIEVLMRMPELPSADRAELMNDVEAQLQELTNLIGDLVDLARHEERQVEPIEVRLDSIVERAVDRARRRAPGLTFDVHLTPGSVRAQPALLERAILNVLDNSAKWSPPGGTVDIWLQRGSIWTLDVHDHGPGINADDLPYVFDRFYRAASARSMPGSGLGLAIVRQVIGDHGGTVTASVAPEGGTVVHIELPTVTEVEADVSDSSQPAAQPL